MMFWIEIAATVFGFLCVVLTIRRNIWCWPVGLVQVLLFIVIFYNAKLYSDLGLHVIYVGLQFYGWYAWTRRDGSGAPLALKQDVPLVVEWLPRIGLLAAVVGTALGSAILGYVMSTYTDAALPYGDAFTTVASLVATWMLAAKKVESWMFWIAVDVVAIGIYYYKDLIPTCILYCAFLGLATIGLIHWWSIFQKQSSLPNGKPLVEQPA